MNPAYLKINKKINRTIIIGDIHGCYEEMLTLLNSIEFGSNDLLIAAGDLVDRGPDSWKVASFFRDTENAHSVLGNHERRVAGVIRGTSQPAWSQLHTLSKLNKEEHDSWAEYFESLPAVIETPHAIITHARIDPDKKVEGQDPYYTCGVGSTDRDIDLDEKGSPRWFHQWEVKQGCPKPLCIGHIDYNEVELDKGRLFALDTSAVKGHQLSAVVFPEATVVSVDCHNYYSESRAEWREQEYLSQLERVKSTPLHEITKLVHKEHADEYDVRLLTKFHQLMDECELISRFDSLRHKLFLRFGVVPPAGSLRGDYVKSIRSHFASSQQQRLIGMLLSDAPFKLDKLMTVFQKSSLEELASVYARVETWLHKPG